MLHLSEFSGPDTLLLKTADEGCCSEPSTELSRLPVRDTAAGYPGGKKRGWGRSDGGAVRGRAVPETSWDGDAGGVGVAVVGSSGVLGCALPLLLHRAVSASVGNCACIKVSILPVHVYFGCACFCVRLGAYACSKWIRMCTKALYMFLWAPRDPWVGAATRGAPFPVPGVDSCSSFLSRRLLELGFEQLQRRGGFSRLLLPGGACAHTPSQPQLQR